MLRSSGFDPTSHPLIIALKLSRHLWLWLALLGHSLGCFGFAVQSFAQDSERSTETRADDYSADNVIPRLTSPESVCNPDRPIQFGGLDWDSNAFHVEVVRYLLEEGFGCKTDVIPGTSLPLLTALGRGDIDVLMEVWFDNITEAWNKLEKEGLVEKIGINFPDAIQGFYVPTYLIEGDKDRGIKALAPNLQRVEDLVDYWELFKDPEQPNKGRFHNCILGWACEDVNTKKLHAYGLLERYVNFRPGTGAALKTAIASAYERGEPIIFYYWGPTSVLGQYDLTQIEEPTYNKEVWDEMARSKQPDRAVAYPKVPVYIGGNSQFLEKFPGLVELLKRYKTTNAMVSAALAYMQIDESRTPRDAALNFLRTEPATWQAWVGPEASRRLEKILKIDEQAVPTLWHLDIGEPINEAISYVVREYQASFDAIARPIRSSIITLESFLSIIPGWTVVLFFGALGWLAARNIILPLLTVVCLGLIGALGLWALAMQTLALMLISTIIAILIGIPIGIALSYSAALRNVVMPVLDAMQTMPSFVYLIPALMLFGLGKVPAVFATVIYAVSPLIRLTYHGIKQVDPQIMEAARSFGASRLQLLRGVQLPLALPTIMTGINQTTMLALSMVVIASMIGSRGLGEEVLLGIQKLDVGRGFTGGIAIVALAIVLDRITQAFGRRLDPQLH